MAIGYMPRKETVVTLRNKRLAGASNQSTSGVSAATRRQVSSLFATAKKMYAPGGEYMAGTEEQLRLGQKRSVATGMQNLAASGMAGTSMAGNLGMIYEQDVGQPTRSAANTQRLGALAGLLQAEAGAMSNLATRYSTSPGGYGGGGGGVSYAPRPATSAGSRSRQTAQPAASKQPTFAWPDIFGTGSVGRGGRAPEGGSRITRMVSRTDPMVAAGRYPTADLKYYNL